MTKTYDLTTGSLAKHFMRLAVPAAIGMVFSTLYNVVDVFFAGMIGTDAQAGLAISFQAFFIFVTIAFVLNGWSLSAHNLRFECPFLLNKIKRSHRLK